MKGGRRLLSVGGVAVGGRDDQVELSKTFAVRDSERFAGVAYATVILTAMVLIFAEVLPKTYALRHPDRTALFVAAQSGAAAAVPLGGGAAQPRGEAAGRQGRQAAAQGRQEGGGPGQPQAPAHGGSGASAAQAPRPGAGSHGPRPHNGPTTVFF